MLSRVFQARPLSVHSARRGHRAAAFVVALSLTSSCGRRDAFVIHDGRGIQQALVGGRGDVISVGLAAASVPAGELGVVLSARSSSNGKRIAVLDAVRPQLKIFDAHGALVSAWQPEGFDTSRQGAFSAVGVADTAILVAHLNAEAVGLFGFDGHVLRAPEPVPIRVLAAVALPQGGWLLYGPRAVTQGSSTWLHCLYLRPGYRASVTSGYVDSVANGLGVGVPYGIAVTDDGAIVEHRARGRTILVHAKCTERTNHTGDLTVQPLAPSRSSSAVWSDSSERYSPTGIASAGNALLRMLHGRDGTLLLLRDSSGEEHRVAEVAGDFAFLDSRSGGALIVRVDDPWPHLVVAPERIVARHLTRSIDPSPDTLAVPAGARDSIR